uniref:Uncharacterized protein n=1 Tax=Anguilla anguilla TaxID=7936 RepID=A0A0E9PDE9_ANGAN
MSPIWSTYRSLYTCHRGDTASGKQRENRTCVSRDVSPQMRETRHIHSVRPQKLPKIQK